MTLSYGMIGTNSVCLVSRSMFGHGYNDTVVDSDCRLFLMIVSCKTPLGKLINHILNINYLGKLNDTQNLIRPFQVSLA